MSAMYGADVAALRTFANQVSSQADRLESFAGWLTQIPRGTWVGTDADRFFESSEQQLSPALRSVVEDLRHAATDVITQADQQDAASGVGGIAGSSGQTGSGANVGHSPTLSDVDPNTLMTQLSNADALGELGMSGLKNVPKVFKEIGAAFSLIGVVTGGAELVHGIQSGDGGEALGGGFGAALGVLGLAGAAGLVTLSAPVAAVVGVAGIVASSIAYTSESQDALLDFQSKRMFGTDRSHLSVEHASQLVEHYSGPTGWANSIRDQFMKNVDDVGTTIGGFFSLIGGH